MASRAEVICGDCLTVLRGMHAGIFNAVVTDPPYGLVEPRSQSNPLGAFAPRTEKGKAARAGGFMGKAWDSAVPGPDVWAAVLRVLRPGGYMLVMGGPRTYHRLAVSVEDAGFEIRDCLMWLYGSGFPKGSGCLKPAYEPILLCRKPSRKVLPLGIDACRVPGKWTTWQAVRGEPVPANVSGTIYGNGAGLSGGVASSEHPAGRWPANVAHDGSDEVLEAFAAFGEKASGSGKRRPREWQSVNAYGFSESANGASDYERDGDTGTAARFFYTAKASKRERGEGNNHPTVKPLALFRWLVKLITLPGGLILDPFGGSGTTAIAALAEGRSATLIEKEASYVDIARKRIAAFLTEGE
jgi:site-specific DNA-methyltransferase (adenine-specific)